MAASGSKRAGAACSGPKPAGTVSSGPSSGAAACTGGAAADGIAAGLAAAIVSGSNNEGSALSGIDVGVKISGIKENAGSGTGVSGPRKYGTSPEGTAVILPSASFRGRASCGYSGAIF